MTAMTTSLGSDPEFFITDKKGRLKSIIGLLGGTKDEPRILDIADYPRGFAVQEDNVAAEYNIPASYSREQFIEHIVLPQQAIAALLGTDKYTISTIASASFPPKELLDPRAQEFGCDPDYNAWTGMINEKPDCDDKTFRTAGGHVHLGVEDKDPWNIVRIIRNMDKYVGVWSVLVDPDEKRRQLYGKAGAFRPQPHGVEYRTLSNFWIFDRDLIGDVWDRTQAAVGHNELLDSNSNEAIHIQHIINNGDKQAAKTYLREQRIL